MKLTQDGGQAANNSAKQSFSFMTRLAVYTVYVVV